MFRIKALIFMLFALFLTQESKAQDIHYTQMDLAPLSFNASQTGQYEGTFRIGGIYRDQWSSVIANQFITPSIYIDAPILSFGGGKHWLGAGAVLVYDQAGTVTLKNTSIMGSLAAHFSLDAEGKTILSVGGQGGIVQKRVDAKEALTQNGIITGGTDPDVNLITKDNVTYGDFNAGVSLKSQLNKDLKLSLGFSSAHISQPNYSTFVSSVNVSDKEKKQPIRYIAQGELEAALTPKWTLTPRVLYQTTQSLQEVMVQAVGGYHFTPEKDVTLKLGAGYRLEDAAAILLGFDYKGFKIGAAYDVNVSDLSKVSKNRGGFELGAAYIAKINREPVVKPIIFCPRF